MDKRKITRKVTFVGAAINLGLSAIKVFVGFAAHSQALIADGVHSLSDLFTDAAIILGETFWSKPADDEHPYGHGRIETLVTIFIGFALLTVAIGIGVKAVDTIAGREFAQPGILAGITAAVSIISKELLYRWTIKNGAAIGSRAVMANAWHHRSDALSSLPVMVSVILARIFPRLIFLDQVAALIVMAMLLVAAWKIMWPCFREILESRAGDDILRQIREIAMTQKGVMDVHKVRTRFVGPVLYIDMHVIVPADMPVRDAHDICDNIQHAIRSRLAILTDATIHIEPPDA